MLGGARFKLLEISQRSIGRKLSNLLYTAPEDDWSDLGIERNPKSYESDSDRKKSDSKIRSSSRYSSTIKEWKIEPHSQVLSIFDVVSHYSISLDSFAILVKSCI